MIIFFLPIDKYRRTKRTHPCHSPCIEHLSSNPHLIHHTAPIPLTIRQGCANTLLNLASDPGREIEITKCGAVSVLLITALVASDSDDTRHACTKAMTNLLCEKKVRAPGSKK